MEPVTLDRATNRRVLGSMNELAFPMANRQAGLNRRDQAATNWGRQIDDSDLPHQYSSFVR